jgi:hypothetical protein
MMIVSRRVSLLMLSFAFFLLLAPALFSPSAFAQEVTGFDFKNVLPAAVQGGIGVIMLIVIWMQNKKDAEQRKRDKEKDDQALTLFTVQLTTANDTTKLAFEKYNESTQLLIGLLKASQEQGVQVQKDGQETTSLLTGTLSRLEVKLAQPVQCPLKEFSQLQKGVQG